MVVKKRCECLISPRNYGIPKLSKKKVAQHISCGFFYRINYYVGRDEGSPVDAYDKVQKKMLLNVNAHGLGNVRCYLIEHSVVTFR